MSMMRIAICCVVFLSGCAVGGWHRDNTSAEQFYQDRNQCDAQSASSYPPLIVSGAGVQGPSQTRCTTLYGVTNCTTTPGLYYPGATNDANAINRNGMLESCLRGKGYYWRTK